MSKKNKIKEVDVEEIKAENRKARDAMTDEQRQERIDALLDELRACADAEQKKGLRAKLRRLGHVGGLGERSNNAAPVEPVKEDKAPKGKKKAKAKKAKEIEGEETSIVDLSDAL